MGDQTIHHDSTFKWNVHEWIILIGVFSLSMTARKEHLGNSHKLWPKQLLNKILKHNTHINKANKKAKNHRTSSVSSNDDDTSGPFSIILICGGDAFVPHFLSCISSNVFRRCMTLAKPAPLH